MKTAVDSSVLLAVFNGEPSAASWVDLLIAARREGQLVVCDVVYAELSLAFATEAALQEALRKLGVSFESISPAAAWHAGASFRAYRDAGGPRNHLIPDFLIAAHAQIQANRLAASDRGYLRSRFPGLNVIHP
ncbi:MAG TPA: type II toxin-antitoxin system VapC family toxin [Verrucomicrobiota bacterium]|nr:type II toxin-antitoxin system VapC family toxin [Verrucomicrobiota bacterium]HNU51560.1 type II toxin-antitoxin system VapC family toxin [Verrucomicrobiota bacterium]